MAIDSTDLALVTARVHCCRLGASRLGFTPYDVKGPSSPYPCEYIWREVQPPTTQWTLITEGTVCGKRPVADFTYSGEVTPGDPPVAAFSWNGPITGNPIWDVEFTDASSGDITSWDWDLGDGNSSTDQNPVHTYAGPGPYTVVLTVTGPGGADTDSQVVDMNI